MPPPWPFQKFPRLMAHLLLCASLCFLLGGHQFTADGATYTVGAFYATGTADAHGSSLYALGLSAPVANNISPITYSSEAVGFVPSSAQSVFASFNSISTAVAILGPTGGDLLFFIYSTIVSNADKTPMFSPLLQTMQGGGAGAGYHIYNDKTYWIFASDQAQAAGIMYILSQRSLVPITQAILTNSDSNIGIAAGIVLSGIAPSLGITLSTKSSGGQTFSTATYSSVFASAPGVVYQVLECAYTYPTQWIEQMITDTNFVKANTSIASTITFDYITLEAYNNKASSATLLPSTNMITASPVPGILATEYQAATDFATEASSSISSVSTTVEKNFIMAGWIAGVALMQAVNKYTGGALGEKSVFFNALDVAQTMYLTSDLFFGTLGGDCSAIAQNQGAIYKCRWGGNNVWFNTFVKTGSTYDSTPLVGVLFQYAQQTCGNIYQTPTPAQFSIPRTIHVVGFSPSDNDMVSSMCSQTVSTIDAAANTNLFWHHSGSAYRGYCLPTTMSSASSGLSTHQSTYVTTSLMGVIPDAIVTSSPPSSLILDFMPQTTQLHVSKQNFVYLFPTLEQELYVLASYLSGVVTSTSVVCAVVSSSTYSGDITTLLKKTLTTFSITPSSGNVNQPTGALSSSISASCTHTFVIGAASTDAAGILGFMQDHSESMMFISFEDLTKQYSSFVSAFGSAGTAVTNRLVFATNLPSWTGSTMSSGALSGASALSTVEEFVQTLSPAAQTPAAVRAFIVAMLYDQLTIGTSWGQPNMQAALYGNRTVHVGGMTFGPFKVTWGTESLINYGALNIAVWSYTRVVDPSTALLAAPINPSLVYLTSTPSPILDAVTGASEDSCFELQASSSAEFAVTTTTTTTTVDPVAPTTTTSLRMSSSGHTSSSPDKVPKNVLIALAVILAVLVVYILIMLLIYFGVLQCVVSYLAGLSCWRLCGCFQETDSVKSASKVRATQHKDCAEDRVLESGVRTIDPATGSVPSEMTIAYLEVEHWRALWARQPEAMALGVRHLQRCVRRTCVKNCAYEVRMVEGMWVLLCPSVDDAISLCHEAATEVAQLHHKVADVISAEYLKLSCPESPVKGLRLRIAINNGPVTKSINSCGRAEFRGAAVDSAVAAAYAAGAAGLMVLTASALARSSLSDGDDGLQNVGKNPLLQDNINGALYSLSALNDVNAPPPQHSRTEAAEVRATLHFLEVASTRSHGGLSGWCMQQLEAHYAHISEQQRIADLQCLAEFFSLPVAFTESHDSEHAMYRALLQSVSEHLASMMECRHGLLRSVVHQPPRQPQDRRHLIPSIPLSPSRQRGRGRNPNSIPPSPSRQRGRGRNPNSIPPSPSRQRGRGHNPNSIPPSPSRQHDRRGHLNANSSPSPPTEETWRIHTTFPPSPNYAQQQQQVHGIGMLERVGGVPGRKYRHRSIHRETSRPMRLIESLEVEDL